MESQPENPEFRNIPENFHPCEQYCLQYMQVHGYCQMDKKIFVGNCGRKG